MLVKSPQYLSDQYSCVNVSVCWVMTLYATAAALLMLEVLWRAAVDSVVIE